MKHVILAIALLFAVSRATTSVDRIQNNALYYQQDARVPMTSLSLVFHGAGSQQEQKAGLASLCAETLFRGTTSLRREEINKRFALYGAEVSASANETDFTVSIVTLTTNLDSVLALVHAVLNGASFPADEVDLVRKQQIQHLDASLQSAEGVLREGHLYVLYDGAPLGKFGSRKALSTITRDDVVDFFAGARHTSVLYFTSISDLPKTDIIDRLAIFMKGRSRDGFTLRPEVPYTASTTRKAVVFDSPGATNDRFRWSTTGIALNDDRRFCLALIMDALGSSDGYLFDELRNKKGWCYGAYGVVMQGSDTPGRILYYADPTAESSEKLIPEMIRLIDMFADDSSFQAFFAGTNESFKNRYAYQRDPNFKIASEINRDRYGVPVLDRESYDREIDRVDRAMALKVIHELVTSKGLIMVFNGDAKRITRILRTLDPELPVTVLDKEALVE